MGSNMSTADQTGIVVAGVSFSIIVVLVGWYLLKVSGEVASVKARLQDVWSIDKKELKLDRDRFEPCGQSSSGELICRAEYRGLIVVLKPLSLFVSRPPGLSMDLSQRSNDSEERGPQRRNFSESMKRMLAVSATFKIAAGRGRASASPQSSPALGTASPSSSAHTLARRFQRTLVHPPALGGDCSDSAPGDGGGGGEKSTDEDEAVRRAESAVPDRARAHARERSLPQESDPAAR